MSDMTSLPEASPLSTLGPRPFPRLPPIPRARYFDEGFYRAELEHVFRRSWHMVGHVSEYPNPGSYRLLDLPFAPVVVVRGKDGVLRAFLNSCQHRGATVLKQKEGTAKVLSCQYHGWTYDLAGQLIGVPHPEYFPGFDMTQHHLSGLRCELWGGFIFVNCDADAQPLSDFISAYDKRYSGLVADAPEQPLRVVSRKSYDVNCNWKAMVEAFTESYHAEFIHPTTVARWTDNSLTRHELYPNGHGFAITPYWPKDKVWEDAVNASDIPNLPGMKGREEQFGLASHTAYMFPNNTFPLQISGFISFQMWPMTIDHTRIDVSWYGVDWGDGPRPTAWEGVIAGLEQITLEDMGNMCSIQKSMEADPGKGNILGSWEPHLYHFHAAIDKCIGVENIPPHLRVPDPDALREFVIE